MSYSPSSSVNTHQTKQTNQTDQTNRSSAHRPRPEPGSPRRSRDRLSDLMSYLDSKDGGSSVGTAEDADASALYHMSGNGHPPARAGSEYSSHHVAEDLAQSPVSRASSRGTQKSLVRDSVAPGKKWVWDEWSEADPGGAPPSRASAADESTLPPPPSAGTSMMNPAQ
jgi:hypothetical protein